MIICYRSHLLREPGNSINYKSHRHRGDDEKKQNLRKKSNKWATKRTVGYFPLCGERWIWLCWSQFTSYQGYSLCQNRSSSLQPSYPVRHVQGGGHQEGHTSFGWVLHWGALQSNYVSWKNFVLLNGCNSFCRIATHHVESDDPEWWLEDHRVDGIGYGEDTAPHDRVVDGNIPMPSSIEELKAVRVFSDKASK